MFRNVFISEFSFSPDESPDSVLKSHLLSNEKVIIPAASISKTDFGKIISSNLFTLGNGCISIAHGNDRDSLQGYIEKYPNAGWDSRIIELFSHFDEYNLRVVYDTKNTIYQFNKLIKDCASGKISQFKKMFLNKSFCSEIITHESLFTLNKYFSIIDKNISNNHEREVLKAHARYFYNYFGSFATESGNTFSLENTTGFNYIAAGSEEIEGKLNALNILISCALDLTDGIEDFDFLSNLDKNFLDKLSYRDVLEIRQSWLHQKVVEKYENIVRECASSYLKMSAGQVDDALVHIEQAIEIRKSIIDIVKLTVKSEIQAYKIHRLSRFLVDTAISSISYLSGINLVKSILQGLYAATTEIAVLYHKEKQLKRLVKTKFAKIEKTNHKLEVYLKAKSPVTEYLHLIERKLKA